MKSTIKSGIGFVRNAFLFAMAAFTAVAAAECPRWISVMPLKGSCLDELARDCADLGNTTIVDGIAWSCPVNPGGDPVADKASMYAAWYGDVVERIKPISSVKLGILLQATMGHGGFPGSVTPWQLTVKPDGTSVYRMCPMDRRFLDYIARTCRTFSEKKPDFFMVDDDTRMVWGLPGCFCPLHLAEFSRRTGREWTREAVVKALESGDVATTKAWEEVKVDSLRKFFKTIRDNFSADIPGMLCVVGSEAHLKHAREFAQILAAPGQTPIIRGSGAPYHGYGKDLFHVVDVRGFYARQLDLVGRDVVYMQELDSCPHTLWATSAVRMYDHLVMLALEGCKGAKMWITRTGNYHEKKSGAAYRRIFRENRGLMEWVAKVDFRQSGVVVPLCGPVSLNFGDRYLALTGIPCRYGRARPGEVTALTADALKLLDKGELRAILAGKVIVDGPGALWLSQNGYSADIGVAAKPWKRKTVQIHEFEDGFRQYGMRTGELTDISETASGAKVLTKLFNVPKMGDEPAYEAPGSVLFENARGGKILSMAQALPKQMPVYYESTLFSERYKSEMIKWLTMLGGGLPGGACYLGVGHVTCESGTTDGGDKVFVLNYIDLDGDDAPEMQFEAEPLEIERLQGDGSWKRVEFKRIAAGAVRIESPVLTQRPAIFRWR